MELLWENNGILWSERLINIWEFEKVRNAGDRATSYMEKQVHTHKKHIKGFQISNSANIETKKKKVNKVVEKLGRFFFFLDPELSWI